MEFPSNSPHLSFCSIGRRYEIKYLTYLDWAKMSLDNVYYLEDRNFQYPSRQQEGTRFLVRGFVLREHFSFGACGRSVACLREKRSLFTLSFKSNN